MQDSVQYLTLKNGEQVATIGSYILEKEELEKYLDISNKEIRELERKVGKLAYLANANGKIQYDTILVRDTVVRMGDSVYIDISHVDEWIAIHGHTILYNDVASTTYDSIYIPCPLKVGLTDDYRIWVETKNPHMTITDLEGAVISSSQLVPKKKRWNVGVQVGFGGQYGIIHKTLDVGPYVGVGIAYGFDF